ncbi:recombination protein RecR [Boudabousia tangfeifanii]|uniref:Recombination protein RecR n=1 Tax=Boudabousia tangfeifanii TaxID=1912795 RepID=A0A1D9MIA6_9ACTO|nr:recombination mediator RecR [Boudabousia tangfeifanii]AOZ72024.1 recombination protein RecR [Boudabousia tangfeifanii]
MYDGALQDLIDELGMLPGVGPKSAQRIAFHILDQDQTEVDRLIAALKAVKVKVHHCETCGNLSENDQCRICADPRRDNSIICVVEQAQDVQAIERTHAFRGLYHVLGGAIDPIRGIGPDQLRVKGLLQRLADGTVKEVVIATDPNIEGEATATYLARMLETMAVPASRLALGLPVGGDLEYADEITLGRAFEGRRLL